MNRKTIIPLLGAPCSGKSTAGRASGFQYFSSGDLLRERAAGEDCMAAHIRQLNAIGGYLDDDSMMGLYSQALGRFETDTILSDGVPRTLPQVDLLEALAARNDYEIPFAIFFDCPEDILEIRYVKRAKEENRNDDTLPYERRFSLFTSLTMPVVERYEIQGRLQTVDASQNKDDVLRSLTAIVDGVRTT